MPFYLKNMKKVLKLTLVVGLLLITSSLKAANYFISTTGNDTNPGTFDSPFASLSKAQSLVVPGDTVFIRGGRYVVPQEQIMTYYDIWGYVFDIQKSGTSTKRICYHGYKDERPVFDLSQVKPANKRVIVFYVKGSNLHFKNFEVVGTQVTIVGHTQSEAFRLDGGNSNIFENIAVHDGMAIGFYIVRGMNNLIVNCDAYNNYDTVSDGGKGGNVDGFGGHPKEYSRGNVFRGCRAWYNSDDGFDLINSSEAVTIEHCWSFYNGYRPGTFTAAGDGSGFKSGGYGMSANPTVPAVIPRHVVRFCLAYYNRSQGFYANHHLGGINWHHNTAYQNPSNYNMLNRKSAAEIVDVPGYGHQLYNNVSLSPRSASNHIINVNTSLCELVSNSFAPADLNINVNDFMSVDAKQLMLPRKSDGSLPDITFLKPKAGSKLLNTGTRLGYSFSGPAPDLGCFELDETTGISQADKPDFIVKILPQSVLVQALSTNYSTGNFVEVISLNGQRKFVEFRGPTLEIPLSEGVYILRQQGISKKIQIFGEVFGIYKDKSYAKSSFWNHRNQFYHRLGTYGSLSGSAV